MQLSNQDITELDRIYRLNLINSVTGIKPGNLIASKSASGASNVAIFSSIVHLGSNPALIGFIFRPQAETKRDTYTNVLDTGYYTINHIPIDKTQQAHYTSAKFDFDESEFETCGLTEEYMDDFPAPFVAESQLKMGMKLEQMIPITANNTILAIGRIEHLFVPDAVVSDNGFIDLGKAESAGVSGLNSYYKLQKIAEYPYARVSEIPDLNK